LTSPLDRRSSALLAAVALPPFVLWASGRAAAGWPVLAAIAAVSAGLLLLERGLGDGGFREVAVPTAIAVLYGTGLLWYEVVEPGPGALLFLFGAALARAGGRRLDRPALAGAAGAVMGAVLLGLGLLGEALRDPRVVVATPLLLDSLFSSRHGLLFWTPVLTAALLGLLARAARGRADAWGALGAIATMAAVNACLRPWWSGGLGNERFAAALPLFALGLAVVLDGLRRTALRRPLRLAAVAGAALVAWNLLLMAQYRAETIPRDDTVSFPVVAENSARLVSAAVGAPTAWPANWIFARRHALPPGRFDLLAGQDVLAAGARPIDIGDLATDGALLAEGWSVRHPCGPDVCREVEGRARLLLPVVDPRAAEVWIRAMGAGTLQVAVNGRPLAAAVLAGEFTEVGGRLAEGALHRGPNEVVLDVGTDGRALVDGVRIVAVEGGP
jgi:hypothetical protein